MEKPKKSACGCFGFLRKRVKKQLDRSVIIESIHQREKEEIFQHHLGLNSSVDHSFLTTQKIFSPANFYKSTIIAPSCKTPQVHNILSLPEPEQPSLKPDISQTTTHLTNPNLNLREVSENCIILQERLLGKFNPVREIKQKVLFPDENQKMFENEENKKEEVENKVVEPIISPGLELIGKSTLDKNLPMLEISPIKSIMSMDDYSDIVAAMAHVDTQVPLVKRRAPDLFIKAYQRNKQMPLLKPTTPRYIGKRNLVPKMRRDNQLFIENFLFK